MKLAATILYHYEHPKDQICQIKASNHQKNDQIPTPKLPAVKYKYYN